mmetsp:Transcript_39788/g.116116  ORF Transcript_39788/g.116116 Transcript_39788/m.116116 type:complete len:203 (-) Transcript_39788:291-899(-)
MLDLPPRLYDGNRIGQPSEAVHLPRGVLRRKARFVQYRQLCALPARDQLWQFEWHHSGDSTTPRGLLARVQCLHSNLALPRCAGLVSMRWRHRESMHSLNVWRVLLALRPRGHASPGSHMRRVCLTEGSFVCSRVRSRVHSCARFRVCVVSPSSMECEYAHHSPPAQSNYGATLPPSKVHPPPRLVSDTHLDADRLRRHVSC